ncbi:MAG: hypothetical protein E7432_03975 [Ruminococcaceae bacterium]|nr:hypothetical protein [Oscillospiraceae bacterium]
MGILGIIGAVLGFILKAIGFVLLFILAVLVIVLITPIKIGVIYPELTVYVKWNGIKYTILPMKKKDKKDKKDKKKPEIAEAHNKKDEKPAETAQAQTAENKKPAKAEKKPKKEKESFVKKLTVEKIKAIIKIVFGLSRKILKGITFEQLYLMLVVADEDKAKMAEDYGKLCIVLIEAQPVLEKIFTIKDQHINVGMDFSKSEMAVACDLIVYVRPVTLLIAAVAALIQIKKEGII